MKMKRLLAIICVIFALAALAGCQARSPQSPAPASQGSLESPVEAQPAVTPPAETDSPESAGEAPPEAEVEEPLPEAPADPVNLDYYFMGSQYGMGDNPGFSSLFDAPDGLSRLKEFYGELNKTVDRVEYHPQSL